MQPRHSLIDFILKEWLLIVSGVGVVLTSIYSGHLPAYSLQEMEVLFILFALFVVVQGLRKSGLITKYSRRIEQGKHLPLKLVITTFFLSMLVTNDVVLLVTVPIKSSGQSSGDSIYISLPPPVVYLLSSQHGKNSTCYISWK